MRMEAREGWDTSTMKSLAIYYLWKPLIPDLGTKAAPKKSQCFPDTVISTILLTCQLRR